MAGHTVTIERDCPLCGKKSYVENVDIDELDRWLNGAHVQDAFPDMSAGDRETLVSGCHEECFDVAFKPTE